MDKDLARKLRAEGKTLQEIADTCGVTKQRVQQVCLGVTVPPKVKPVKEPKEKKRPGRKPGPPNPLTKLKASFHSQKAGAKRRGVAWELTFDQWLAWWGTDIELRGTGHGNLQMQRYGDTGPYALGNIKKGRPVENSATWQRVLNNKKAGKAKREHEEFLDALMFAKSTEAPDEVAEESIEEQMRKNGRSSYPAFAIDNR